MADEITVSVHLDVDSPADEIKVAFEKIGLQFDLSGSEYIEHVQTIGTSEEALVLGDVGTVGWFAAVNLDPTNYIELRANTAVADTIRMNPGEPCLFRWAADAVPYAIANTAACRLAYLLIEA